MRTAQLLADSTELSGAEQRLLAVLANLNRIGAAINRISPRESVTVEDTLRLIAESAIEVVPGSSAVIYTYDHTERAFDPASRVSAGEWAAPVPNDVPRPDGMGMRSIRYRRRVLSYEEPGLEIHPAKVSAGAKAVVCFPLIVADQAVGALYVYLHQNRRFTRLELLMLENFVNQAAMAIYQARRLADARRDLARKEDELNRLRRAGLLISSRLRLDETLEAILQMAMEVTDAQYGTFRLVDKSGQNLVTRAFAGERLGRPLAELLPIDASSVVGWVATHRQPVCIHDLHAEPWVHIYRPISTELSMRSELAVPLIGADGRLEGVLNLESPLIGAFDDEDRHLLQSLATQAVIAIQEVRLLDALQEAAQLLLTQPYRKVLEHLAESACDLLNAPVSAIWILENNRLVLQVASGVSQYAERLPLQDDPIGRAIAARKPVTTDNASNPCAGCSGAPVGEDRTWAMIVPLLTSDELEPLGAFCVHKSGVVPGRLAESEWDEKVLTCLAHYAALAVQNAAHQKALRTVQEQHAVAETFAAVGDLAANVLHHLNNKVGSIPVRVQGIRDKCQAALAGDAYLATNLAEIERSACEAMEAVRESLAHLHPVHLSPVNIAECVRAAVREARLPEGIVVNMENLEGLPPVVTGERNLVLVFANLLDNAADALHGRGTVTIGGTMQGEWVEIAVSDDGPGIPPELHERIFEFNFSDRGGSRPGKLGFGLWWVKTLMLRLGGSVTVESDGLSGTTFRVRLPCAGNAAATSGRLMAASRTGGG
jgi:GAF domain-containing protein